MNTKTTQPPAEIPTSTGLPDGDVPVGRKLDALVHVKLFGETATAEELATVMQHGHWTAYGVTLGNKQFRVPLYSTTGDGMMLVLEQLRKTGRLVAMFVYDDESKTGMEQASVRCPSKVSDDYNVHVKGNALPEAVCRAALRVVETESGNTRVLPQGAP